jgi:hypothetical protein
VLSLRLLVQGHINVVRPELHVEPLSKTLKPALLGGVLGLDMIIALE